MRKPVSSFFFLIMKICSTKLCCWSCSDVIVITCLRPLLFVFLLPCPSFFHTRLVVLRPATCVLPVFSSFFLLTESGAERGSFPIYLCHAKDLNVCRELRNVGVSSVEGLCGVLVELLLLVDLLDLRLGPLRLLAHGGHRLGGSGLLRLLELKEQLVVHCAHDFGGHQSVAFKLRGRRFQGLVRLLCLRRQLSLRGVVAAFLHDLQLVPEEVCVQSECGEFGSRLLETIECCEESNGLVAQGCGLCLYLLQVFLSGLLAVLCL
mmetsp:Transcript_49536/g.97525  ORF Transcript_49536/g.97525 Transcript_49536/m.97525 type:complete len:263 (-) Transcript_49536:478-1266(-)